MKLSEFKYDLEKERIAQFPSQKRDKSRLFVSRDNKIEHKKFSDIVDYFEKGDVLVLNHTKVEKAKLIGKKETGANAEIILEKRLENGLYKARVKTNNPKMGNVLVFDKGLKAQIVENDQGECLLRFNLDDPEKIIDEIGQLPLPGYIKRSAKKDDEKRYQTVYAEKKGSLAAPTAGLHFTEEILDMLIKKGVVIAKVCLHVGFGTFLPVRSEDITKHKMHPEYFEINKKNADLINNRVGRLFVVGTTSLRALESSFKDGKVVSGKGITDIFIYPGYKFKNKIDALITNFHLPGSTLIMLVSAFIGRKKTLSLYEEAKKKDYRFFSYGDCMLLFKENSQPQ